MSRFTKKIISMMLICGLLISGMNQTTQAKTEVKRFTVNAAAKSKSCIQLLWKAKKVTKYKIYRTKQNKDGNIGKYKLVATLSGKKTSYVDKKLKADSYYWYLIRGYKNKKVTMYSEVTSYTGILCGFGEYQIPDAARSTKAIELNLCAYEGMKPDGYKIYRKEAGAKKFKLLKTLKKKANSVCHIDKKVVAEKIYYYKARSYKKIGKKVYYSKYTNLIEMSATNQIGNFDVKYEEDKTCAQDEAVLCLTSKTGNGEMVLSGFANLYITKKAGTESVSIDSTVTITEYSKDKINWTAFDAEKGKTPSIKAGEVVWVKIKAYQNEKINTLENVTAFQVNWEDGGIKYNHLRCNLELDILSGSGSASVFAEIYH